MRAFALLLCLLLCPLVATADERLIWQPLNSDARLSEAQWRQIWRASARQGVHTVIVQWTRFGDERFGESGGWLAEALRAARAEGLALVLGLYYDPDYYQQMSERDDVAFYWHQQLGLSLEQARRIERDWQLPIAGWYLPMELDDWNFRDASRRVELQRQLSSFAMQLGRPLHLSAYSGGFLAPQPFAAWLDDIAAQGIEVWWQDGVGTAALAPLVRLAYASALPCRVGVIREAFRQISGEGEPFAALPGTPRPAPICHASAVFELRYRPWGRLLYEYFRPLNDEHSGHKLLLRNRPRLPASEIHPQTDP
ncbi:DUF4434 domain-containing protein [Pseudomonas sp. NPDC077382]